MGNIPALPLHLVIEVRGGGWRDNPPLTRIWRRKGGWRGSIGELGERIHQHDVTSLCQWKHDEGDGIHKGMAQKGTAGCTRYASFLSFYLFLDTTTWGEFSSSLSISHLMTYSCQQIPFEGNDKQLEARGQAYKVCLQCFLFLFLIDYRRGIPSILMPVPPRSLLFWRQDPLFPLITPPEVGASPPALSFISVSGPEGDKNSCSCQCQHREHWQHQCREKWWQQQRLQPPT